jgi:hypothetical protein
MTSPAHEQATFGTVIRPTCVAVESTIAVAPAVTPIPVDKAEPGAPPDGSNVMPPTKFAGEL